MTKDEAKSEIEALVKKYNTLSTKEIRAYNEANTKQAFILPLFKALGWNIYDTAEVSLEENASAGRVDFAFKINNVARFYIEAKKLGVDLNNQDYIKQAITYAYNNGVTWAILTNFTEMRFFNAQRSNAFIALRYDDYLSSFNKLWLLSREAQQADLLDKEAAQYGAVPPMVPIEEKLFKQLREWRERIYNELLHYNEWLNPDQRDEVIEKLFNRLIFIRTAEDRNLEEHRLRAAVNQWENTHNKKGQLTTTLHELFSYYNGYYDSDLFKQHLLDDERLWIDEHTLKDVINGLYDIPGGLASYDFSLIDADVLGRVYEQYLGYVSKHVKARAKAQKATVDLGFGQKTTYKLVEKKQRRKEQGIYYTPKFVTDYIVKETVGRFIKEHNHNEIMHIKILDPACGSGSFLIRAYDELLKYYADQKGKSAAQLDQFERLPVLTQNIFGVDLDQQAVEIARLNLLLRALAKREILPPLTENIKRGNSLISGTDEELQKYFGDNYRDKHPFNWETEFEDIMSNGGFDVVIGNPPYVRIQAVERNEADYYRRHFDSAHGSFDLYVLFIEQSIKLLKNNGILGLITSGKFLKSDYGKKIQELVYKKCTVTNIIDLSAQQVFGEATTYPVIFILKKGSTKNPLNYVYIPENAAEPGNIASITPIQAEQEVITKGIWPLRLSDNALVDKLTACTQPLCKVAESIFVGLQTSADKVYVLKKRGSNTNSTVRIYSRSLDREVELERALLKPLLMGNDIERYKYPNPDHYLLFPYTINGNSAELITEKQFIELYPLCWQYLLDNRKPLEDRENGKMNNAKWYGYSRIQNLASHDKPKILTGVLAKQSRFTYDDEGAFYFMGGGNAGGYGITLEPSVSLSPLYILGLLNSKLLDYNVKKISSPFRGGFFSYAKRYIANLPIRQINFDNPAEKAVHDKLVSLVEKMLEMNKKLILIQNEYSNERDNLIREIEKTDKEIDNLVYDLYGLTEEERRIIEEQTM